MFAETKRALVVCCLLAFTGCARDEPSVTTHQAPAKSADANIQHLCKSRHPANDILDATFFILPTRHCHELQQLDDRAEAIMDAIHYGSGVPKGVTWEEADAAVRSYAYDNAATIISCRVPFAGDTMVRLWEEAKKRVPSLPSVLKSSDITRLELALNEMENGQPGDSLIASLRKNQTWSSSVDETKQTYNAFRKAITTAKEDHCLYWRSDLGMSE